MNGEEKATEVKEAKTSLGLKENVEGLFCYLVTFITGILFLLLEKESKFVRFHAMQSTVTFLSLVILQWILGFLAVVIFILGPLFGLLSLLVNLVILILWIVGMIRAYQGEMYKFPIFGNIAESFLK